MPPALLVDWCLFTAAILGGGAALAPIRPALTMLESWCAGIAFALAILGGAAGLTYTLHLPAAATGLGYAALATAMLIRRRQLLVWWQADETREPFISWTLVSAAGLALLACVFSYSGGAWMGDWEEHYQRPLLLLGLRPEDEIFRRIFPFTSRPPLANLVDASLLQVVGATFARHQVMMLLLNSLSFLPVALFARTFGGGRGAGACAALLCLLCPVFLQNLTYAWTKLITAFFVLTAVHLLFARPEHRDRIVLGFALLALGVLTHYSAGVWLLTFGGTWLLSQRKRWLDPKFRATVAFSVLIGLLIVLPWFGYAFARYGVADTLGSNSAYQTASQLSWSENLRSIVPKLWNTLIPHPLRSINRSILDQANPWTWFRDQAFYVYQSNLFFGLGTAAVVLTGLAMLKRTWQPSLPQPHRWLLALALTVMLGTAVHGNVDPWGLAHICLSPLILLGVALAAARLPRLRSQGGSWLVGSVALLATIDFLISVVLHYMGTAMQLNRPSGQPLFAYAAGLSAPARYNLEQKMRYGQDYFMDTVSFPWWVALVIFVSILLLLGIRAGRLSRAQP